MPNAPSPESVPPNAATRESVRPTAASFPMKVAYHRASCLLAFALPLVACEAKTPIGQGPSVGPFPEDYDVRPLEAAAAESGWLVRVREGEHGITGFAVAGDTLIFSTRWEAVYRVDLGEGTVSPLDVDSSSDWRWVNAGPDEFYWVKATYDERDYPQSQIRQSPRTGNAVRTVFRANWGILDGREDMRFHVDASGIYLDAHDAGGFNLGLRRIPAGGGAPQGLLLYDDFPPYPSWVVDDRLL